MKKSFYLKLAAETIRRNRRLYLPFVLTGMGAAAICYILGFLAYSDVLNGVQSSDYAKYTLGLGFWVVSLFSALFLFYTNAFLMRRRQKEMGLYSILGMNRKNLSKVLGWEALLQYSCTVLGGLAVGILFSKLFELCMVYIMGGKPGLSFIVSGKSIQLSMTVFSLIYLLLLCKNLRSLHHTATVSLMKSENQGEKPPKANWLLGIGGVLLLGVGYGLAVSVKDPYSAILSFFLAVLLVIIGTYLVMICGSVLLCRILQKNKKYYYRADHFISTSSMAFRMKRNGAGLASVCILLTMVLVMLSSTSCLYFGKQDVLDIRCPRQVNFTMTMAEGYSADSEIADNMRSVLDKTLRSVGGETQNVLDWDTASIMGAFDGDILVADMQQGTQMMKNGKMTCLLYAIDQTAYNMVTGKKVALSEGEAILLHDDIRYRPDTLTLQGGSSYRLVQKEKEIPIGIRKIDINAMCLVVPDLSAFVADVRQIAKEYDIYYSVDWGYSFDTGLPEEDTKALWDTLHQTAAELRLANGKIESFVYNIRAIDAEDYLGSFSSLFFLGGILSAVFICSAAMILYYKQISEGLEDRSKFEMMQKVGLQKSQIRRSVNSQMLTVFFLPLGLAGLHIGFAFHIIYLMLQAFGLYNLRLFLFTTALNFAVIAGIYVLVYRLTSGAYYHLVSDKEA